MTQLHILFDIDSALDRLEENLYDNELSYPAKNLENTKNEEQIQPLTESLTQKNIDYSEENKANLILSGSSTAVPSTKEIHDDENKSNSANVLDECLLSGEFKIDSQELPEEKCDENTVNDFACEEALNVLSTDLTLTKTVELTEFDQEPEIFINAQNENAKEDGIDDRMPSVENVRKQEFSQNFECTMDDISDGELESESLSKELDEIVAGNEFNNGIETCENVNDKDCLENGLAANKDKSFELSKNSKSDSVIKDEESSEAVFSSDPVLNEQIEALDALSISSETDESNSVQHIAIPSQSNEEFSINESNSTGSLTSQPDLGAVPPHWIPDNSSNSCMQCFIKFSLIKRRHHCRACGLLLCSSCCNEKFFLKYLQSESRICTPCHETLLKTQQQQTHQSKNPNPNIPNTYCSTIPVQQQVNATNVPPTVLVPTGVLRRSGQRSSERKSVIFSDGIRPGTDLDELFTSSTTRSPTENICKSDFPLIDAKTNSFIPNEDHALPPVLTNENEYVYEDNNLSLLQRLRKEECRFALNKNFYVTVKVITLICCTSKTVINFSTSGLLPVRQDEILILIELNDEMTRLPKEIFIHLNDIYLNAEKKNIFITEYGSSQVSSNKFLEAFGGFLYIRPTFQCLQSLILPENPFLIGILVHKWEVPWMKLFPLRLVLRLGALYRYYPTPILSNINREPVFAEIGNTILNFLADFRNFSYTIEIIKGLNIHMEEKKTSVLIPRNKYDILMKVINNSTDHLLSFGADFSKQADGHLVCIQNIDSGDTEPLSYCTQAINIQGQNRIRTGASFLILNGALKQSSGLKGKCSIVEDGLMIQIFSTKMQSVRDALKNMKDIDIPCGPISDEAEEIVEIRWVDDDVNFNVGVMSPIDNLKLDGKESIRTRLDISTQNHSKLLRWSEVFLLESNESSISDDLHYSKLAEPIAKASGNALLPFLDLMAVNQLRMIGIRVTLGENIKYLGGSNGVLFSPIYMNALDNELIAIINRQTNNMSQDCSMTMELIFYILNK